MSDFASTCVDMDGVNTTVRMKARLDKTRLDDVRLDGADNVLVSSYPRTGTTWLTQIVSLLMAPTDEDYDKLLKVNVMERVLYLEHFRTGEDVMEVEHLPSIPLPRTLKTHLPFRFIRRWVSEDGLKTIVTTRHPKDTMVSHYHFSQKNTRINFTGTWDEFFAQIFQGGKMMYGDQYSWFKDWSDNRDEGSVLFIRYEAMKRDIRGEIQRIINFLGLDISDARLERVLADSSLQSMKDHPSNHQLTDLEVPMADGIVRAGKFGEWKRYFTVAQNEWFDAQYKKLYADLDIDVEYD